MARNDAAKANASRRAGPGPSDRKNKPSERGRGPQVPAQKQPKARTEAARASAAQRGSANSYLAAQLQPQMVLGVKVPDQSTFLSSTFQTVFKTTVVASAAGTYYACIAPTLTNGLLFPGINISNGDMTLMYVGSPDLSPDNSGTISLDIVADTTLDAIRNTYSDTRFVSMSVEFVATEAALSMQGLLQGGRFGRGQWPAQIDDATNIDNANGLAANLGTQGNGFANINDVMIAMPLSTSLANGLVLTLGAQDYDSMTYRNGTSFGTQGLPQVRNKPLLEYDSQYNLFAFENIEVIDEINEYVLPGNFIWSPRNNDDGLTFDEISHVTAVNTQNIQPWLGLLITGAVGDNSVLGEMIITVNWEALPLKGSQEIVSSTPSPSDPAKLAQAQNVMSVMPSGYIPGEPAAASTRAYSMAGKSTGSGTSLKRDGGNKESGSMLSSLASVLQVAIPAAGMIASLF